ncbi:hypothetical protein OTU49_001928 [Cherax quadricarinatus]|uniref:HMG box domain-containing protein n=1 Tax=Cherax quadricarinatus TaxID=27406 RepID=A0AAW0XSS4_CHEQU|nr:transcription factor Sox-8-like isoform X2 [Cherax quadricarinatus]
MESVKKERVSPLLPEGGGTYCPPDANSRPCGVVPPSQTQTNDHKTTVKSYLASVNGGVPPPPPPPPTSALSTTTLASVISTTTASSTVNGDLGRNTISSRGVDERGVVETVLLSGAPNFSGEISDAVAKILEDYDWSKIPLANNERRKVHVKRPMNAFMVWAQEARRKLSCSHRQVHNAELSKSLGRIWRSMTEEQKRPFIERADHLRRKHKQEYPDYKYQPRRRKENVKTVSKPSQGPMASHLGVQDLSANHYVSSVKSNGLGLSLHPLSPPHSPSGQGNAVRGHTEGHLSETVFVPDCLADSFETIDRAEMNKYLLPDQGSTGHYVSTAAHAPHANLQPMSTMSSMNSMTAPSGSSTCSGSLTSGGSATHTSLPPLRLLPSAPVYGSSGSPYYSGGASPQPGSHGSPDIAGDIGGGVPSVGGISPGGSPGSPVGEYVELQPPRVPKEEPLPPLTAPKPSNVNPFLHQNLCYPTQSYAAFQYPYPYAAMWH